MDAQSVAVQQSQNGRQTFVAVFDVKLDLTIPRMHFTHERLLTQLRAVVETGGESALVGDAHIKLIEVLRATGYQPAPGSLWFDIASAVSTQSILLVLLAIVAGIVLAKTPLGYMVFATGGSAELRVAGDVRNNGTFAVRDSEQLVAGAAPAWMRDAESDFKNRVQNHRTRGEKLDA